MPEQKLKCLRCGHEYKANLSETEIEERTCPKCRSNSVRLLKADKSD